MVQRGLESCKRSIRSLQSVTELEFELSYALCFFVVFVAAAAAVNWDDEDEDQNGESNANPPANRERHHGVDSVSNAFAYIVGNACKFAINRTWITMWHVCVCVCACACV